MSLDPRLTPILRGTATRRLEGVVPASRFVDPAPRMVCAGALGLHAEPDLRSEQNDQLLYGERFEVLAEDNGWAFGQACRDGYVGWASAAGLAEPGPAPTHRLASLRSVLLAAPSPRAPALAALTLNSLLAVAGFDGDFARTGEGYVPRAHLAPLGSFASDPAAVAEAHLGAPYLWGGRGAPGIDCSGLVQQALYACGLACPRDSDQQAGLGRAIDPAALRRGDLVVWKGHIGVMADAERLIHASGLEMRVLVEPLAEAALKRFPLSGPPIAFRRL